MADVTDTEIDPQPAENHLLYELSPYCQWVSRRYGAPDLATTTNGQIRNAAELQLELAALWQEHVEGTLGLDTGPDAMRLAAQQRLLRWFRHRCLLEILQRDLAADSALENTLAELSVTADVCINQAVVWATEGVCKRYGQALDDAGLPVNLVVIGMGKLGGCELNVSSDIDLIFAYRANGNSQGPKVIENSEWCRRVAQRTSQLLHANTEDSFVYRVDTRLRPFGESGPLVMSFEGMEHYYLTQGRTWERYAMIKARVVVGSTADAQSWYELITPFVYRRYLDYSTIESLAELKQKISSNLQNKALRRTTSGWNVKLGRGGIREVEFIVQSFQLVRGGRDDELQGRNLLTVLLKLAEKGLLSEEDKQALTTAYVFFRRCENTIQAIRDQQVHELPSNEEDKDRLLRWLGYANWNQFDAAVQEHREAVASRFDDVFQSAAVEDEARVEPHQALQKLGIEADDALKASLKELTEGGLYQRLTASSQQRIDRILPIMITLSAKQSEPAEALSRCLVLVRVVAGRSGYLQALIEQPSALSRLVHVLSRSRWIVDFIAKHPIVIDELLTDSIDTKFPTQQELMERALNEALRMADAELDVQMDALRQFQKAHECRVAVAELNDTLPLMQVSDQLTWLAEAVLAAVMQLVYARLARAHGNPYYRWEGARCASHVGVVAYGKLGGIELAHGSDLDVVFVHDSKGDAQLTDGERSIANTQFYARLAQRVVSFMTTLTPAGTLYDMDLRLRPNGSSGVLVTSITAFEQYQASEAWTWEHQALSRARIVYGPSNLVQAFNDVRKRILSLERDEATVRRDVRDMRQRMRTHLGSSSGGGNRVYCSVFNLS